MRHLEDALQMQVWSTLTQFGVTERAIVFHPPNGGKRNHREAGRMKAMGVVPGVPDLCFLWDDKRAFIELKVGRNTLSPKQKIFRNKCREHGIPYEVCRTLDEVLDTVAEWGLLVRTDRGYSMKLERVQELASAFGGE